MSSFLYETRRSMEPEYRWETAAQQAIIDSNTDLLNEIKSLRRDLSNSGGAVSDHLAYAILKLVERLERS